MSTTTRLWSMGNGQYAIAVPITDEKRWRVVFGTSAGLGASAAKSCAIAAGARRRGAISPVSLQGPSACWSPGSSIDEGCPLI